MTNGSEREAHIHAWEQSGLTKTAYAKTQGIKRTTFYRWFREQRTTEEASNRFLRLRVAKEEEGSEEAGAMSDIELYIPNGYRLIVRKGFDRETFAAVLDLVESR